MTQKCLISLKALPAKNSNARMRDSEARKLYGTTRFSGRLSMTRQQLFTEGARKLKGLSISGVQQKLSMYLDDERCTLLPTDTQGTFIIKPSPDQFPCCAEMEHLGMLISKKLGIDTAQCALVEFADGEEKAYVTKRFDRQAGSAEKLIMEDLCSLSDLARDDKYNSSYETAGLILKEATGGKLAVMQDYFKRVLAAYLMGNEDLHLKNLSVYKTVQDTGIHYRGLTPNYDCVPTIVYGMGDMNGFLAMPLMESERQGQYSEAYRYFGYYTQADFYDLGRALGLTDKAIAACLKSIDKQCSAILELIACADIPDIYRESLTETIQDRNRAIQSPFNPA